MWRISVLALLVLLLTTIAPAPQEIVVAGSTSFLPLLEWAAHRYALLHPGTSVAILPGGSYLGAARVQRGSAAVGVTDIWPLPSVRGLTGIPWARTPLLPVASPGTPSVVTLATLRGLWAGRIRVWAGGQPVVLAGRAASSGARLAFLRALGLPVMAADALSFPSAGAVAQVVRGTPGATGYLDPWLIRSPIRILQVRYRGRPVRFWLHARLLVRSPGPDLSPFLHFLRHLPWQEGRRMGFGPWSGP